MLKVNNRNNAKRCQICSKLTIKILERRQWRLKWDGNAFQILVNIYITLALQSKLSSSKTCLELFSMAFFNLLKEWNIFTTYLQVYYCNISSWMLILSFENLEDLHTLFSEIFVGNIFLQFVFIIFLPNRKNKFLKSTRHVIIAKSYPPKPWE